MIDPAKAIKPDANEEWKIKGGYINHITGTTSTLALFKREPKTVIFAPLFVVDTAIASMNFALNCVPNTNITEELTCDTKDIPINQYIEIGFAGGSGAKATLIIEVTKIDVDTGEKLA